MDEQMKPVVQGSVKPAQPAVQQPVGVEKKGMKWWVWLIIGLVALGLIWWIISLIIG